MSTLGTAYYNDIVKIDSPAVKIFKDAGAIILVKSNVPQVLSLNSYSHRWFSVFMQTTGYGVELKTHSIAIEVAVVAQEVVVASYLQDVFLYHLVLTWLVVLESPVISMGLEDLE